MIPLNGSLNGISSGYLNNADPKKANGLEGGGESINNSSSQLGANGQQLNSSAAIPTNSVSDLNNLNR